MAKTKMTKKKKEKGQSENRIVEQYDKAFEVIEHVEMVSGLLYAAGQGTDPMLEASLVRKAGYFMQEDVERLKEMLRKILNEKGNSWPD